MSEIPESITKAASAVPVRFTTDSGYCDLDIVSLRDEIARAIMAEREACAYQARNGCLVPPDGGSPTEAEAELCEEIARRIRNR